MVKDKKPLYKTWWIWAAALLILILAFGNSALSKNADDDQSFKSFTLDTLPRPPKDLSTNPITIDTNNKDVASVVDIINTDLHISGDVKNYAIVANDNNVVVYLIIGGGAFACVDAKHGETENWENIKNFALEVRTSLRETETVMNVNTSTAVVVLNDIVTDEVAIIYADVDGEIVYDGAITRR